MSVFQDKDFVFFISAGRTGTKFFGDLMSEMIPDAFSVHEPDVVVDFKLKSFHQIRIFGLYNLILGKLVGKTGIRNLSQNYLSGRIKLPELISSIIDHRETFYKSIPNPLIIESYSGWYGVIPAIQKLFRDYRIIVILRDPRSWVKSNMDWGTMYGKRDWVSRMGLRRLNPKMIHDHDYIDLWEEFTRFQKLCWAWRTIYTTILSAVANDPNALIVRFEDVFYSPDRYTHIERLLSHTSSFMDCRYPYQVKKGTFDFQKNVNIAYDFPPWDNWSSDLRKQLIDICGSLGRQLGYKI
jgi:hypothetical protein